MSSLIVEVVKIKNLDRHPNADTLLVTTVKGWNCIVKEGEFNVGDLAVYIPVDSVLPEKLIEEHKLEYLKKGERVITVKLRGYVSQGLLLPLPKDVVWSEGRNVAEELGITKWEPPVPNYQQNVAKGNKRRGSAHTNPNPNFHKYTSIENIKNYNDVFEPGERVCITEKIHGTNFRVGTVPKRDAKGIWERIKRWFTGDYEYIVGSHNVQLTHYIKRKFGNQIHYYDRDVYNEIAKRYNLDEIVPEGYALYGEIYGQGIQDLTYGLDGIDVAFFDMKCGDRYVDWEMFKSFCIVNHLPMVPILFEGPYFEGLLETNTKGKSMLCPSQIREGCVIKTTKETNSPRIGRKILKSISEDYLLRKGGTEYQ